MQVKPRETSNYKIDSDKNKTIITIPFKKNYYVVIAMLLIWIFGILFWFDYLWIILGLPVLFGIVNILLGKEIISIDEKYLVQEYRIGNFLLKKKVYDTKYIKNIKTNPGEYIDRHYPRYLEIRFWGPEMGRISFNYGKDTFRIIGDIEETEGEDLVVLIKKHITCT